MIKLGHSSGWEYHITEEIMFLHHNKSGSILSFWIKIDSLFINSYISPSSESYCWCINVEVLLKVKVCEYYKSDFDFWNIINSFPC